MADEQPPHPGVAVLDDCLRRLREHFENVQIFCNKEGMDQDDETGSVSKGRGNWFARYGQVVEWTVRQNEHSKCRARRDDEEDQA